LRTDDLLLCIETQAEILYYKPEPYVLNRNKKNILLITDQDVTSSQSIDRKTKAKYSEIVWSIQDTSDNPEDAPQDTRELSDSRFSPGRGLLTTDRDAPYGGAQEAV